MARAVALGPDLLLLDEPAAGTNDVESLQLIDSIRRVRDVEKCAILLIDHDLPFVMSLRERIYVRDAGKVIAEGSPKEVQADTKVKEAYLGTEQVGASADREVYPLPDRSGWRWAPSLRAMSRQSRRPDRVQRQSQVERLGAIPSQGGGARALCGGALGYESENGGYSSVISRSA